jgi:hypothetical protein
MRYEVHIVEYPHMVGECADMDEVLGFIRLNETAREQGEHTITYKVISMDNLA